MTRAQALDTQQLPDVAVEVGRLLLQAFVAIRETANTATAAAQDQDSGGTPGQKLGARYGE